MARIKYKELVGLEVKRKWRKLIFITIPLKFSLAGAGCRS